MNITEEIIRNELGLKRQQDLFGVPYYEYGNVGIFYPDGNGVWYFRDETLESVSDGVYAQEIITSWEVFKGVHLWENSP